MKIKSVLSGVLLFCSTLASSAQTPIVDGGVYQFVNSERASEAAIKATNGSGSVTCATPDQTDKAQLWVAEATENGFYLRNLLTGHYLTSSLKPSKVWTCTPFAIASSTVMNFRQKAEDPERYVIYTYGITGTQQYAHCDGRYTLVCWGPDAEG